MKATHEDVPARSRVASEPKPPPAAANTQPTPCLLLALPPDVLHHALAFLTTPASRAALAATCSALRRACLSHTSRLHVHTTTHAADVWARLPLCLARTCGGVRELAVVGGNMGDEVLEDVVRGCCGDGLETLALVQCTALRLESTLWLPSSPTLSNLTHLRLSKLHACNLAHHRIACPSLVSLCIAHASLGSAVVEVGKRLRALALVNCELATPTVLCTAEELPRLQWLFLGGTRMRQGQGFPLALLRSARNLSLLDLSWGTDLFRDLSGHAAPSTLVARLEQLPWGDDVHDALALAASHAPDCVADALSSHRWSGGTVLHKICNDGDMRAARTVVSLPGLGINVKDRAKNSPLFLAAAAGHAHIVRHIIALREDVELEPFNVDLETPLYIAALRGHVACVQALGEALADEHGKLLNLKRNFNGWTPLLAACVGGHFPVVEMLLQHDVPTHETTRYQETPLHMACRKGDASVVELLLKFGANANTLDDSGNTPRDVARKHNHERLVSLLEPLTSVQSNPRAQSRRQRRRRNRQATPAPQQ